MIHNLENTAPFHDDQPDSPICGIGLPVVVELSEWDMHVVGTATLVAGHLAITARHIIDYVARKFGMKQVEEKEFEINYALRLYQVLPGPIYRIWNVHRVWTCSSDIAVLHLGSFKTSAPDQDGSWATPILRALPPPVGSTVIAFGYRESKIQVSVGKNGQPHIDLNARPTSSFGKVTQIYPDRRDSVFLSFPCFEVEARFDPGMSGGLVIDELGHVCGLVCAGLSISEENQPPVGYVATLWPMFKTIISANRAGNYAQDVDYPMIELALNGLIHISDLHDVMKIYFSDKVSGR